jgi:hypothetical protein
MVRTEQYTSGGEFKLPDGTNYVGAYHVHVTRGAMVGAYHKNTPHDRLTASNDRTKRLVQNIIQQLQLERSTNRASRNGISPTVSSGNSSGY